MGDRYTLSVKCDCGFVDDDVWYAPTCGFLTWECPKCKKIIDLEKYSGIDAVGCATTEFGEKSVKTLKQRRKFALLEGNKLEEQKEIFGK